MSILDGVAGAAVRVDDRAVDRPTAEHVPAASSDAARVAPPTAVGLDLGSGYTRIWASGRALLQTASVDDSLTNPIRPVQRGRISDPTGLREVLVRLLRQQQPPVPAGAIVVACRPVLTATDEQAAVRHLLGAVLKPSQVLFIDTVRAAAIGAGAGPGTLLVADVGAGLTEVAVLAGGSVTAARRADLGLGDLLGPNSVDAIVQTIAELVADLRRDRRCRDLTTLASANGLLLVGGGAAQPSLAARTAATVGIAVRVATKPRIAAVQGAGLAALAALRRTAVAAT